MASDRKIEESVQKLANTYLKDLLSIFLCTVQSVDIANRQCDCLPIGSDSETFLPGVLLCAENNNGFVVIPSVGSTVIVAISTRNTAFVLMYSDIASVQFMDGSYGGIVKIIDPSNATEGLLVKINNLEKLLNSFIATYNLHTHAVAGGTASPTPNQETSTIAPITTQADLENQNITHGLNS